MTMTKLCALRHIGNWRYLPCIHNLGSRWRQWFASCLDLFTPWARAPRTHLIVGWVTSKAHLDVSEKSINLFSLLEVEPWNVKPVTTSLYRLRYPGAKIFVAGFVLMLNKMENRKVKWIDWPLLTVGIAKRIVLSYEEALGLSAC
jgi:hypothetical protein